MHPLLSRACVRLLVLTDDGAAMSALNGSPKFDIATTKWEDILPLLPPSACGYSAKQVFENTAGCVAYTYDDLILMPGTYVSSGSECFFEDLLVVSG